VSAFSFLFLGLDAWRCRVDILNGSSAGVLVQGGHLQSRNGVIRLPGAFGAVSVGIGVGGVVLLSRHVLWRFPCEEACVSIDVLFQCMCLILILILNSVFLLLSLRDPALEL
jgi:hypothetical protein